jgi:hypothetical protein
VPSLDVRHIIHFRSQSDSASMLPVAPDNLYIKVLVLSHRFYQVHRPNVEPVLILTMRTISYHSKCNITTGKWHRRGTNLAMQFTGLVGCFIYTSTVRNCWKSECLTRQVTKNNIIVRTGRHGDVCEIAFYYSDGNMPLMF